MDRGDWLASILLFLIPVPFISTDCLVKFSMKFMKTEDERVAQDFRRVLARFRWRQLESLLLIVILFIISLVLAYFVGIKKIPYLGISSAILLTHAAFGQLGWEIQTWSGDSVIEAVNKWWFRILYSFGVVILFVAILTGE